MPVNSSTSSRACTSPEARRTWRAWAAVVSVVLGACADSSSRPDKPTAQEIEQRLRRISADAIAARTTVAHQPVHVLAAWLPDALGSLTATAAAASYAAGQDTPARAERTYANDQRSVTLELADVSATPQRAFNYMLQVGIAKTPNATTDDGERLDAFEIEKHPALSRFKPDAQQASVTLMVSGRFLVEFRSASGSDVSALVELARSLPLTSLVTLATTPHALEPVADLPH